MVFGKLTRKMVIWIGFVYHRLTSVAMKLHSPDAWRFRGSKTMPNLKEVTRETWHQEDGQDLQNNRFHFWIAWLDEGVRSSRLVETEGKNLEGTAWANFPQDPSDKCPLDLTALLKLRIFSTNFSIYLPASYSHFFPDLHGYLPIFEMPLSCPECDAFALSGGGTDTLLCTACNAQVEANFLPLFLISGASGTGKSTLIRHLRPLLPDCVVVGGDLLIDVANRDRQSFLGRWLRVAYATAQSGYSMVVAGVIEKAELDAHVDSSLVGQIYVIGLHTNEDVRVARLEARPRWAKHSAEKRAARIAEHIDFTRRITQDVEILVDTTENTVEYIAQEVAAWIKQRMVSARPSKAPAG